MRSEELNDGERFAIRWTDVLVDRRRPRLPMEQRLRKKRCPVWFEATPSHRSFLNDEKSNNIVPFVSFMNYVCFSISNCVYFDS